MNKLIYLISGIVFGLGLSLSGMIDPEKVISFLSIGTPVWNPALAFVLGSAVPVYFIFFMILRKKKHTLNGTVFNSPPIRKINKRLVVGSVIFGIGWGISGICPGPALTHLAFIDIPFVVFIATMILGFEIEKRIQT